MSKELKALERIGKLETTIGLRVVPAKTIVKDFAEYNIIETALKALEIIKEKPIVALVDYKYTYEKWLELVDEKDRDLFNNKEEYDLLKEVLLWRMMKKLNA